MRPSVPYLPIPTSASEIREETPESFYLGHEEKILALTSDEESDEEASYLKRQNHVGDIPYDSTFENGDSLTSTSTTSSSGGNPPRRRPMLSGAGESYHGASSVVLEKEPNPNYIKNEASEIQIEINTKASQRKEKQSVEPLQSKRERIQSERTEFLKSFETISTHLLQNEGEEEPKALQERILGYEKEEATTEAQLKKERKFFYFLELIHENFFSVGSLQRNFLLLFISVGCFCFSAYILIPMIHATQEEKHWLQFSYFFPSFLTCVITAVILLNTKKFATVFFFLAFLCWIGTVLFIIGIKIHSFVLEIVGFAIYACAFQPYNMLCLFILWEFFYYYQSAFAIGVFTAISRLVYLAFEPMNVELACIVMLVISSLGCAFAFFICQFFLMDQMEMLEVTFRAKNMKKILEIKEQFPAHFWLIVFILMLLYVITANFTSGKVVKAMGTGSEISWLVVVVSLPIVGILIDFVGRRGFIFFISSSFFLTFLLLFQNVPELVKETPAQYVSFAISVTYSFMLVSLWSSYTYLLPRPDGLLLGLGLAYSFQNVAQALEVFVLFTDSFSLDSEILLSIILVISSVLINIIHYFSNSANYNKFNASGKEINEFMKRFKSEIMRQAKWKTGDIYKKARKQHWYISPSSIKIGRKMESGSFGSVYQGLHNGLLVAIKRLHLPENFQEFCQEAQLLSRLRHPCIVQFIGAVIFPDYLFIVTEFCKNGSLFDLIYRKKKALSTEMKVEFSLRIAQGMMYLHSQKPPIIHGDLKSPNCLIDDKFRVMISDFGTAFIKSDDSTKANQNSSFAATLIYASPEMISSREISEASDVYAYAILLYEIFQYRQPFSEYDVSDDELAKLIINGKRPLANRKAYPKFIFEIMTTCWVDDVKRRPSFDQIISAIYLNVSTEKENVFFAKGPS